MFASLIGELRHYITPYKLFYLLTGDLVDKYLWQLVKFIEHNQNYYLKT